VVIFLLFSAMLLSVSACGGSPEQDETDLGTVRSALLGDNALNGNALNGNGVDSKVLTGSMLGSNPLTPSTLSAAARAAIQDPTASGDLSRQFLKYAVSCAFDTTQSFGFSWVDSSGVTHDETYPGLLALETNWDHQALPTSGQEWVSACLISRVNYFGIQVTISARGPTGGLNVTDATELDTYTMQEGAFFGNLFISTPYAVACDHPTDDAYSRWLYRDCAAGYVDTDGDVFGCPNVQRIGSCDDAGCNFNSNHTYYTSCNDPTGSTTNQVVTVYLHD
jgi:hypothetical protein